MIYLIKACVLNKIEGIILNVFSMITGRNEWKILANIYHTNVNVHLMEKYVIQINGGIIINVDVSVKKAMYVKKIMFGILLHLIVKMGNI